MGGGRDMREGRLACAGVVSGTRPMIIVLEAALPPARTLPTTSWGEGVPGVGAPLTKCRRPKRATWGRCPYVDPGRVTAPPLGLVK
jgi:hypothetical protein